MPLECPDMNTPGLHRQSTGLSSAFQDCYFLHEDLNQINGFLISSYVRLWTQNLHSIYPHKHPQRIRKSRRLVLTTYKPAVFWKLQIRLFNPEVLHQMSIISSTGFQSLDRTSIIHSIKFCSCFSIIFFPKLFTWWTKLFILRRKTPYVINFVLPPLVTYRNSFVLLVLCMTKKLFPWSSYSTKVDGHLYQEDVCFTLGHCCLLTASGGPEVVQC